MADLEPPVLSWVELRWIALRGEKVKSLSLICKPPLAGHRLQNVTADSVCHHALCYLRSLNLHLRRDAVPPPCSVSLEEKIQNFSAVALGNLSLQASAARFRMNLPIKRWCHLSIRTTARSSSLGPGRPGAVQIEFAQQTPGFSYLWIVVALASAK